MKEHISLLYAQDVFKICEDLFKCSGINAFSYSKIYPDGSRAELWSDAKALNHTFIKKKYISRTYTPIMFKEHEKYSVLKIKVESFPKSIKEKYLQQIADLREYFNYDNPFLIIDKEAKYCEFFLFHSSKDKIDIINYYINHLKELESFTIYFKNKAAKLITHVENNKIVKPWRQVYTQNHRLTPPTKDHRPLNYLYLNKGLTKRELKIAHYLLLGKSARECSDALYISKRTVERHIENIKHKLNCRKRSELVKCLLTLGLRPTL